MKEGSAYDLYLTRTLEHATIVRSPTDGLDVYQSDALEAGAGIVQPLTTFVDTNPGHRLLPEPFMQIRQAVGIPHHSDPATLTWLHNTIESLKTNGFIAKALTASDQPADVLAPPA